MTLDLISLLKLMIKLLSEQSMMAAKNSDVSESTGPQQERPNPPNSLATDTMKTIPETLIPIVSPERWVLCHLAHCKLLWIKGSAK